MTPLRRLNLALVAACAALALTAAPSTAVVGAAGGSLWSPGTMETIVGFGTTSEGGELPGTLQEAQVPITTDAYCAGAYSDFDPKTMVCAGFPEGCARPNKPGVHARVGDTVLREWIRSLAPDGVD